MKETFNTNKTTTDWSQLHEAMETYHLQHGRYPEGWEKRTISAEEPIVLGEYQIDYNLWRMCEEMAADESDPNE